MKIKNNKKSRRVLLEFEEFYVQDDANRVQIIDQLSKEFNARRMAYNMWEFIDQKTAEEFIFLYRLKHESNRKAH
jgi:hypothetical protein